jgi:regulatory protein
LPLEAISQPPFFSMQRSYLTSEQALRKLHHYCAYQERCHKEVREKLWELGIRKSDHDILISSLIEDDYLNEQRFANAFAGGKFRMKQWGRVKIKYELKQKQVSEYCIKKAMKEIPEDDYTKTLHKLAKEKLESLKGEQHLVKKKKAMDYLLQKGFEAEKIREAIGL